MFIRTNLPKEVMAFPGFPFKTSLPSFIRHEEVLNYLQEYSSHYDLQKFIKVRIQFIQDSDSFIKRSGQQFCCRMVKCMHTSLTQDLLCPYICNLNRRFLYCDGTLTFLCNFQYSYSNCEHNSSEVVGPIAFIFGRIMMCS
jgi:hypothetical protein